MSITLDRSFDITIYSPQCLLCKNYRPNDLGRQCKAFVAIPLPIWNAQTLHDRPYPGDHGVQFDPIEGRSIADVRP